MDLALNNPQRLICHKTKQTKLNKAKPEVICLHTVIFSSIAIKHLLFYLNTMLQVLLFNIDNSIQQYSFIYKQLNGPNYCKWLDVSLWPVHGTLRSTITLGVMAIKWGSTFSQTSGLEPQNQMVWYHIQNTHCWEGVLLLCR